MKHLICAALAATAALFASAAAPSFAEAKPVWPAGRETRMNDFVGFRAAFDAKAGAEAVLRVTGTSVYRIRLNGECAGYGPARAAKGFFRVDEWPLSGLVKDGRNVLAIEVSAYNCNNFYVPDQPAFLQAEVLVDGRVVAATGAPGAFEAFETAHVQKTSRFSFQRAFSECYRMTPQSDAWATGGTPLSAALPLAVQPAKALVERIAPLPELAVTRTLRPVGATSVVRKETLAQYRGNRCVDGVNPPRFKGFKPEDLDLNMWRELQHHEVSERGKVAEGGSSWKIAGSGVLFDNGFEDTGFPGLKVRCTKPGRLWIAFDEVLENGKVNPVRFGVSDAVAWDLVPGEYALETFEAYSMRYLHVYTTDGEMEISDLHLRDYKNPTARRAKFRSSDATLDRIFVAARETFAQNAVDVFMDCPSRERAGWLCDSFFTARSSHLFTGSTDLERLFVQNYLLPKSFDDVPAGMLPMCYPSDHTDGVYIPNWAMWFVVELDEYLVRSGDRATVDALRPRMVALIDFLKKYRNADGLLEKLPSWVFVEWSRANRLVQDVNYPSNMTWAEVLDCMDRMYGMPELAAEARRVRETVRKQSWNGKWFCDNAVRQKDGTLKLSGECTETCQYYAFVFKTATPESHPTLWKTLLDDFGPKRFSEDRKTLRKFPEIWPSNAFIGNYLRLELLSRHGMGQRLLEETKGYFAYMAERTGTLWENDGAYASCNHGFASHAAVFYVKNVLGVAKIDLAAKTVTAAPPADVALDFCEATLPVGDGEIVYGWRKVDGKPVATFRAPAGWTLK